MNSNSETAASIAFGRFRMPSHRRELLDEGRPVKLGGRAFEVLMVLIEAHGAIVTKDELLARVWPDRIVEENNLQGQISALRAAFGPERDLIRTVSGRGYQFTGEIRSLPATPEARADAAAVAPGPRPAGPLTNLPAAVSELIGRDQEIAELLKLATAHRLVTLTGAGGIGKTRLTLTLARELLPHFADGAWLAEFSAVSDPGLVHSTLVTAIGLDLAGGEISAQRVAQALAERTLLLVLDTCEHVIGEVAMLAEAVLRASSAVLIIATSREPLRVDGEWIYPVPPLSVPAADAATDANLLLHGAVRLFVDRARAAQPHFAPEQRSLGMIAGICRRLDGIPLAIELAAARAATLGIEEVATGLDDRLRLLSAGRRTALPRHQTLRATFDWSHELLSEPERVVLRRLAIFAGAVDLAAATAVVASPEISPPQAIDSVASLATKSLVAATVEGPLHDIDCLIRHGSTRLKSSTRAANAIGLHGVMRSTTDFSSNERKPKPRRGPRPNGSPTTSATSITCARRSTGHSPRMGMPCLVSRWQRQRFPYGCVFRCCRNAAAMSSWRSSFSRPRRAGTHAAR
jgi:predicted ATPase/DNA-binding winged helix-turn-helix (wHTH) protein